jgi:hypothetical protein
MGKEEIGLKYNNLRVGNEMPKRGGDAGRLRGQMDEKTGLSENPVMHPIALAMQGMAFWHLLTGVAALAFILTLVVTGESLEDDKYGLSAMTAAKVTGATLAAALLLGGISWAMLGRAFWRPRWSLILLPGVVGVVATGVFEYMDWPVSYLLGGAVAFWMVRRQLERAESAGRANG